MKIIKPPGKVKILGVFSGKEGESPLQLIELAGRTAYRSQAKITPDSAPKFVKKLLKRGHESVIEHSAMMVRFSNVSRAFTHQLVRHRLASFTQESSRYIDFRNNFQVVCPPERDPNEKVAELLLPDGHKIRLSFAEWVALNEKMYSALRQAGWLPEEARQILPVGIANQIVMTTNFREWRHIFAVRCAADAHWEIRLTMLELLKKAQNLIPVIFDDFEIDSSVPCARLKKV